MPHKCAKFGPWGYFSFEIQWSNDNGLEKEKEKEKKKEKEKEKEKTRKLQNIYACTSPPMYLWCWNKQACRSHVGIVDAGTIMSVWIINTYHHTNQRQEAALVAKKMQAFIFKYRPLGPTYFNIWGIFTIVGFFS